MHTVHVKDAIRRSKDAQDWNELRGRLEGLIPVIEYWHTKMYAMKVSGNAMHRAAAVHLWRLVWVDVVNQLIINLGFVEKASSGLDGGTL